MTDFQCIFTVITAVNSKLAAPCHEPAPQCVYAHGGIYIKDTAVFCESRYLCFTAVAYRLLETAYLRIVDVISGIDVLAYNINIFVTRIPVGALTVIDPDEIVTAVCIRKLVIKVFPQLFVCV